MDAPPPDEGPAALLASTLAASKARLRRHLDFVAPFMQRRWAGAALLLLAYISRVAALRAFHIVTYGLGIYLLNLFLGFITPAVCEKEGRRGEGERGKEGSASGTRAARVLTPLSPLLNLRSTPNWTPRPSLPVGKTSSAPLCAAYPSSRPGGRPCGPLPSLSASRSSPRPTCPSSGPSSSSISVSWPPSRSNARSSTCCGTGTCPGTWGVRRGMEAEGAAAAGGTRNEWNGNMKKKWVVSLLEKKGLSLISRSCTPHAHPALAHRAHDPPDGERPCRDGRATRRHRRPQRACCGPRCPGKGDVGRRVAVKGWEADQSARGVDGRDSG